MSYFELILLDDDHEPLISAVAEVSTPNERDSRIACYNRICTAMETCGNASGWQRPLAATPSPGGCTVSVFHRGPAPRRPAS